MTELEQPATAKARKPKHKRPTCICGRENHRCGLPDLKTASPEERERVLTGRARTKTQQTSVRPRVHQRTSCGHYKAYTDGYCRGCSHSRACCKR